ncbi:MAG: CapA family protein [Candidatus Shapirobacteria bacterium]|jgi:poly-gamma-glutamate synthesis protein (capsule biosynthesis protein)
MLIFFFLILSGVGFLLFIYQKQFASIVSPLPLATSLAPSITLPLPTPTPDSQATIGLVGDLGLGRHITSTARSKNDFHWSFNAISPWLKSNDFNLANLESPIIKDCPPGFTGTFTFCGDTRFLPELVDHKLVLNLANNHIFNYGQKGFVQTHDYLSQNNLTHFYSHCRLSDQDTSGSCPTEFARQEINGITFGFLGYDLVTNSDVIASEAKQSEIIETVKRYDPQVDWLIISIHWGNEYLPKAEPWRVSLAHQLVDAGADLIHGHHPHVWQEPEVYQGKPIFYSFGNFIFDQSWSYATSHSQISRLTFTKTEIGKIDYSPIEIKFNSQPWISN